MLQVNFEDVHVSKNDPSDQQLIRWMQDGREIEIVDPFYDVAVPEAVACAEVKREMLGFVRFCYIVVFDKSNTKKGE